ncbi:MAG: hypothetical protein R3240_03465 [Gammaproteobacteria bacterium]|nr:hypothetical protein [Gammaproteobacteria bacterium]
MNQTSTNNYIRCNSCNYQGSAKTNSGTAFILFFILLCSSVFFLPMIVVALAYMGWIITKPAKKTCPVCKSDDVTELSEEEIRNLQKPDDSTSE